ncbi:hypothetical protein, partial [Methylocaldum sp.]|uniref:hypothetical protein n=1 Tax=Methylocaldum sp. TaxID=1969727 RepID=UPI002D60B4BF
PNMGYWKRRINRIAIIQNYGGQLNYRWVTGHEAWDAIPCGAFPCGNSASVATTVNNDPSVSTVTPTTSTGNLAPNPSFESDPAIDYFTHGTGTFSWAKDVAHTGKASLKIVSSQPNGAITRWLSRTKRITATAGETYTATAWLKSQNLAQNGMLTINFWNSSGQHLGSYNSPTQVRGTSNWTPVSVDAMAPLGSAYARVEFRLYGSGTLWVDDISLTTQ